MTQHFGKTKKVNMHQLKKRIENCDTYTHMLEQWPEDMKESGGY